KTDQTIDAARQAAADFLNAAPSEVIFGPNMTTLTFQVSRSIGRTLDAGDEIVVTRMDHDANIAPWLLLARDHDLIVRWVDFDVETGLLHIEQLADTLNSRTRLVACVYASNALGTINDIRQVTALAHSVGAMTYIDAVQYAPHDLVDVRSLDCDFLACSAYKFFGPHVGLLYGKAEHLTRLPAYKVRPASDEIPDRWETGTKNHEGMAGVTAAVDYLASLGGDRSASRRERIVSGMCAIKGYERGLSLRLIEGLMAIRGVMVRGITDPEQVHSRVPTVIFTVDGKHPAEVAAALGGQGIYVWDGNYYAQAVMERLGLEDCGGMVRVGAVHYNTHDEVNRFLEAVEQITHR
nr:cysteine desulfurase-like protein [Anaerolineae bacterium]